jgi:hypothetical protein
VDPIPVNNSHLEIGDGRNDKYREAHGKVFMWFIWTSGENTDHGYGWIQPIQPDTRLSLEVKETTIYDIVD